MKQVSTVKKHRLVLTDDELRLLEARLGIVNPSDWSLHDFAILRNLYGRIYHIRLHSGAVPETKR